MVRKSKAERAHVLIVNQYFPPDTSATAKMVDNLATRLAKDFKVTVLCGRPSYNPSERDGIYLYKTRRLDSSSNLEVLRVGSTAWNRKSMVGRSLNYLTYLLFSCLVGLKLQPDVVVAMTDPPVAYLPGLFLSRLKGSPLIYNIRDFHPDSGLQANIIRNGRLVKLWDKLHQWAIKHVDKLVVLGEDMKRLAVNKGADPNQTMVIRDGHYMDANSQKYPPPDNKLINSLRSDFKFVVGYAGSFNSAKPWSPIVEAVKKVDDNEVSFVFIGDGPEKSKVQASLKSCNNVRFYPFQPEHKLRSVLTAPDVHIVPLKKGLEGLVVPSKLYPLLAVGKPVLVVASKESDIARIVQKNNCGLVIDPDKPGELAQAIGQLATDPQLVDDFGKAAQECSGKFDIQLSFQKFKDLLWEILDQN